MTAKSRTAKYYASNPEARAKKKKYDTKLNSSTAQKKKRADCNRKRRKAKASGKLLISDLCLSLKFVQTSFNVLSPLASTLPSLFLLKLVREPSNPDICLNLACALNLALFPENKPVY